MVAPSLSLARRGEGTPLATRGQLLVSAALCASVAAVLVADQSTVALLIALSLVLTYLLAFPATTARLLLVSLSFDRFLNLHAGGHFSFRLSQLCALMLLIRLVWTRWRSGLPWRVPWPAIQPLVLYAVVAVTSILWSQNAVKSLGYLGWAAFDVVAVFAVVMDIASSSEGFRFVVRWWIAGAALAAAMGVGQLALGLAHLPVPFVTEYLGAFPRISGFNYEPAYFALYLESVAAALMGLWLLGEKRFSWAFPSAAAMLAVAAISMSRSGWLGGAIIGLLIAYRLGARRRWLSLAWIGAALGTAGSLAVFLLPAGFVSQAPKMAAMAFDVHEEASTAPRIGMVEQAAKVFLMNPLLGVGLGGYGGYIAAHPELRSPVQPEDPNAILTTNLWLEIGAETGLLGLLAIGWFLARLVRALWAGARASSPDDASWCAGLLLSIVLVFGVLYQFNQTLWRLDVWVLLALAWAAARRAEQATERVSKNRAGEKASPREAGLDRLSEGDFSTRLEGSRA